METNNPTESTKIFPTLSLEDMPDEESSSVKIP